MTSRSLYFGQSGAPVTVDRPKKNDDLVDAKIFTYQLQVENTLATWVRNGLLSIRIAFLFYMNSNNSSWVGKLVFFVGPTVILYAIAMYIMNRREVMRLTKTERQDANMYVWPVLSGLFSIALYASAFELL